MFDFIKYFSNVYFFITRKNLAVGTHRSSDICDKSPYVKIRIMYKLFTKLPTFLTFQASQIDIIKS
jgi:hypothetical protein